MTEPTLCMPAEDGPVGLARRRPGFAVRDRAESSVKWSETPRPPRQLCGPHRLKGAAPHRAAHPTQAEHLYRVDDCELGPYIGAAPGFRWCNTAWSSPAGTGKTTPMAGVRAM